jgi:hypothetical protein
MCTQIGRQLSYALKLCGPFVTPELTIETLPYCLRDRGREAFASQFGEAGCESIGIFALDVQLSCHLLQAFVTRGS